MEPSKPDMSSVFKDGLPEIYDNYLAQILFEPYADLLAARVSGLRGRILETAAGTGIATAALQRASGGHYQIIATDSSIPMIERGRPKTEHSNVSWICANSECLPFNENMFDAAICQFGAMFFHDKEMAFREVRRVLKPEGIFIFNVWDKIEKNPIPNLIQAVLNSIFPKDPPKFLINIPFCYHNAHVIRDHLSNSQFSDIRFEYLKQTAIANSAHDIAIGFLLGTPLKTEIENRKIIDLEPIIKTVTEFLIDKFGDSKIEVSSSSICVSATRI